MANISALLEIIRTAHLGRDMRQALHDAIESVNNDTETALGKTLAFDDTTRKLTLKAKDNSVLSEATIPGGTSGSTVAWNQIKQSGEKIATITIDETTTDVYASAGGGGGGGAVDTVNGIAPDSNGNVTVDADHISDTSTTNKFVTATEKSTWNGKQDALTFTSTPSSSNKVVCVNDLPSGGGSNRNLLINHAFTVNQRNFSSLVNFSGINRLCDMWKVETESGFDKSVVLANDTMTVTVQKSSNNDTYCQIIQVYENIDALMGQTVTISCVLNGNIYHTTFTVADDTQHTITIDIEENIQILIILDTRTSSYRGRGAITFYCRVKKTYIGNEYSFTISDTKLELGSVSTLAYDTAPDYTTELLKCQRYFFRINCTPANAYISVGMNDETDYARYIIPLPTPMRTNPTLSYAGAFYVRDNGWRTVNSLDVGNNVYQNAVLLIANASNITGYAVSRLISDTAGGYIDLSAEL